MVHKCGKDLVYCQCAGIEKTLQDLVKQGNFFHDEILDIIEARRVLAIQTKFLDELEHGFPHMQN